MTTPVQKLPIFATAATVPSGPDSGLTSRLEPSAGTLSSGHLANTRTAARIANWVEGGLCDWVNALAPVAYASWRPVWELPAYGVYPASHVGGYGGYWTVALDLTVDAHTSRSERLNSPLDTTSGYHQGPGQVAHTTVADDYRPIAAATNPAGITVVAYEPVTGTDTVVSPVPTNTTVAAAPVTLVSATAGAVKVAYSGSVGFVAYPAGVSEWVLGGTYWTSTDGSTFTARTIPDFGAAATVSSIVSGRTGTLAVGFLGTGLVGFSTDGIAWTITTVTGSSGYTVGLCETAQGWLLLDSVGALFRYNGAAWVAAGTIADPPNTTGALYNNTADNRIWRGNYMCSDGGRAVVILTSASGRLYCKLSLDEGTTWRDVPLAHNYSGGATYNWIPAGLNYSDGQFVAVAYGPNTGNTGYVASIYSSLKM